MVRVHLAGALLAVGSQAVLLPPKAGAEGDWVRPTEFSLLFRMADKSNDKRLNLEEFKGALTTELLNDMQVELLNQSRNEVAKTLFKSLADTNETVMTEAQFRGVTQQVVQLLMKVAPVPTPEQINFVKQQYNASQIKTVYCTGVPKGAVCEKLTIEKFQAAMTKHPYFLTDAQVEELGIGREEALHEQFEMLDVDHDGLVGWQEFKLAPQAGAQLVIERHYAGLAHSQVAPLLMRKHQRSKFLDGLVHTARMCRSSKSECCSHDECPVAHYCYDKRKAKGKKFSGRGGCSPVLSNCCEDRDADPIDRDSRKCPAESHCKAPANTEDDYKASFDLMQLVRGVQRNKVACKSRQSECCEHSDCLHGQYCRSEGKHFRNTSVFIGKCSNYPADCCADKSADPLDGEPHMCPVSARCKTDAKWVAYHRVRTCGAKDSGGECCFHGDCGAGKYCYDSGKRLNGKWNWVGKCSAKIEECCSNSKADALDRHSERCPKSAKCFHDQAWIDFHKVEKLLVQRELGRVKSVREVIFQNVTQNQEFVEEIQWQPYVGANGEALYSEKKQEADAIDREDELQPTNEPTAESSRDEREAAYDALWVHNHRLPDMSELWARAWGTPDTPPEWQFLNSLVDKAKLANTTQKTHRKKHRWVHKHM